MTRRLAITLGDPAGIGPEVLVKAFARITETSEVAIIVIGSARPLQQAMTETGIELSISSIDRPEQARPGAGLQLLDPLPSSIAEFPRGEASAVAGAASVRYFEEAVALGMAGRIDAVVTCPINKVSVQKA